MSFNIVILAYWIGLPLTTDVDVILLGYINALFFAVLGLVLMSIAGVYINRVQVLDRSSFQWRGKAHALSMYVMLACYSAVEIWLIVNFDHGKSKDVNMYKKRWDVEGRYLGAQYCFIVLNFATTILILWLCYAKKDKLKP